MPAATDQETEMSMTFQRSAAMAAALMIFTTFGASAQQGTQQGTGAKTPPGATTPSGPADAKPAKDSDRAKGGDSMAQGDRQFVEKAAMGGMMEVQLGQLAQQKAENAQVKQFGARMVTDHGKANDELKQIASAKGMQLPASVDAKHMADLRKLQSMQGADFDREYMRHMVADHKKDIAEFQKQAKSGKDADLKGFASKSLPTLQEHLKLAQGVNQGLGAGNKAAGPKTPS
jgi:putative membrane protein